MHARCRLSEIVVRVLSGSAGRASLVGSDVVGRIGQDRQLLAERPGMLKVGYMRISGTVQC